MNYSLDQKLPEDILLDVLLRLPENDLCRLKCVSKLWYHCISLCLAQRWKPSSRMIGFLYQHIQTSNPRHNGFLHTTSRGSPDRRRLTDGISLHESVKFLDSKHVYIVTSSNGFLLCCEQMQYPVLFHEWLQDPMQFVREMGFPEEYFPMAYYVCNPASKQWLALPRPQHSYEQVAVGFSCKIDDPAKDLISYTVVRYGIPRLWTEKQSILTVESFSSESSAWTTMNIKLDAPQNFYPVDFPALVIDGIFFWVDRGPQLIAIDLEEKCTWQLELPPAQPSFRTSGEIYASNGRIHYVFNDSGLTRI